MTRRFVLPLLLLGVVLPRGIAAQSSATDPRITVSITVGTVGLTDLQSQPLRAGRIGDGGEVVETELLNRTITAGSGRAAGAAVVIRLSPAWALRMAGGVGTIELGHGFTGPDEWVEAAREVPVAEAADVGILSWDAALRFRIPSGRPLRPYLEVGLAAERWRSDIALPAGEGNIDGLLRIGGQAAAGGDYPLGKGLDLSVRATTRVFRTPLGPLVTGVEAGRTDELVLVAEAPHARPFADTAVELVRGLRLDVGLSYRLGGAERLPPDQPESAESRSALRR